MTGGVKVIATNNVDVFRHLTAAPIARAGVTWHVVESHPALLAAVRAAPPTIAIIDAELAGGDGYAACRAIKDDPALAAVRVAMVLAPRGFDRAAALALAASGCDEVLAPPLSFDDFCTHLARLARVPVRRDRRVDVSVAASIGEPALAGSIANVGVGGVGLRLPAAVPVGQVLELRVQFGAELGPPSRARVAWCRPVVDSHPRAFAAGAEWDGEPALRTRLALEEVALFDLERGPDETAVTLHGDFTELTRFDGLERALRGVERVTFELAAVRYISSAGVRAWCELLQHLSGVALTFRHCSAAFVGQAAMVPLVLAGGTVQSLVAPYYCEACGFDDERLLEVGAIARDGDRLVVPQLACARCGGPSDLDDLPERYFAFLP